MCYFPPHLSVETTINVCIFCVVCISVEHVQVCSDPSQFTPEAPARVHCNGITGEQCESLDNKGFQLDEDDDVCKTRVFEPISSTAEADCADIGGMRFTSSRRSVVLVHLRP